MRAERFGSYSIASTTAATSRSFRLKVDHAIFPLVPAADVPRSEPATVVAAAAALQRLNQRFLGMILRDLVERGRLFETLRRSERPKIFSAI